MGVTVQRWSQILWVWMMSGCVGRPAVVSVAGLPTTTAVDRITRVENSLRPPITIEGDAGWTLEARMEHHGVPGLAVAVIDDFEIAWVRTYGLADRETGEVVTPETLFQAGSISKPVAAFGAMRLVEEGVLRLDEDVNHTLRSWKVPDNEHTAQHKVTLTGLLSHTAGLTVHGFPGYAPGQAVPTTVEVLEGSGPANTPPVRVDLTPGSQWRYSGGGYTVVQLLMSDATGESFAGLMERSVLVPLGMTRSSFVNPLPAELLTHAAAGYLPDRSAVVGKRHTYPEMAAAGLWTTSDDLARFAIEVQRALHGRGTVLSRETAEAMVEPVRPSFGRGFELSRQDDAPYFSHGGWDEGFCAYLLAHRRAGYGIAVMINANQPELMQELVRAVAQEYGWAGFRTYAPQQRPAESAQHLGRYRYNAEQVFTVYAEQGRLYLRYAGSPPEELLYVGEGRYMRRTRTTPILFTADGGQRVAEFQLSDGRRPRFERLSDEVLQPRERLFDGSYDDALAAYRALLHADPDERAVSEGYLDSEGYRLLHNGTVRHGILVMRLNADLHPSSARVWESLGAAYRRAGDREQAIVNYRRALERDAASEAARSALVELEAAE